KLEPYVAQNVHAPAHRDLELGDDVPVGGRPADEIPIGDELHYRRPAAAEAVFGREGFADCCPEVVRAGPLVGMRGQLDAGVRLEKAVRGKQLSVGSERLEDRGLAPGADVRISRRNTQLATDAENRAALVAVEQLLFVPQREVTECRRPVPRF